MSTTLSDTRMFLVEAGERALSHHVDFKDEMLLLRAFDELDIVEIMMDAEERYMIDLDDRHLMSRTGDAALCLVTFGDFVRFVDDERERHDRREERLR